jgi:sugar phosphate isomerase/epimerase
MKIGIGTYALAWSIGVPGFDTPNPMNIYQFMDFVHDQGISLVQIADNIPLHQFSYGELEKIKQKACDLRLEVEVGTRGLFLENIRSYLEITSFFNSPLLRVVIDTREYTPSIAEINETVHNLVPELKHRNIKLAIENHDRLKVREFSTIVEEADSEMVGICLDSVNSIGADEGFGTVFETLAPYTINLHLKDYIIRRKPHMMGFDIYGTPAGQGMMPINEVMKTLKEFGNTRSIILELWPPPEASVQKTIEKEKKWVTESIEFLRIMTL